MTEEVAKKRSKKSVKVQRGIVGMDLASIVAKRNQKVRSFGSGSLTDSDYAWIAGGQGCAAIGGIEGSQAEEGRGCSGQEEGTPVGRVLSYISDACRQLYSRNQLLRRSTHRRCPSKARRVAERSPADRLHSATCTTVYLVLSHAIDFDATLLASTPYHNDALS